MKDLKTFDINRMIKPKGPAAVLALLSEFQAEIANLQAHINMVGEACEAELEAAEA